MLRSGIDLRDTLSLLVPGGSQLTDKTIDLDHFADDVGECRGSLLRCTGPSFYERAKTVERIACAEYGTPSYHSEQVDVRIIAATNRNLEELIDR